MASDFPGMEEGGRPPGGAGEELPAPSAADPSLEDLRAILVGDERRRVAVLEAQLRSLQQRTDDKEAWIAAITPVLGDVIRRKVRDSREEMIEALYPIIGQLIARSVSEAIRDLARSIDERMRRSFSLQTLGRRIRARLGGVSEGEMLLREALPFSVSEIFLVHRQTGLLLSHLVRKPGDASDSDVISGMLTAIRDFVEDAFGAGKEGQLDEVQYGEQRILIETAQYSYLAVVVDGVEPPGFREMMRERLIEIEHGYRGVLREYDGDASRFDDASASLRSLMLAAPTEALSSLQRRILIVLAIGLVLCGALACLAGTWLVRAVRPAPTPAPAIIVVTAPPAPTWTSAPSPTLLATPTQVPTPTEAPTRTPVATMTAAPTSTSVPPTPVPPTPVPTMQPMAAVNATRLNVRVGPGLNYAVADTALAGQVYQVEGRDRLGTWWLVCCMAGGRPGWVSADWVTVVGSVDSVPVVDVPAP